MGHKPGRGRRCRRKTHYTTRTAAEHALRTIQQNSTSSYVPTCVIRCHCGQWVLTSNEGKIWKSGKRPR